MAYAIESHGLTKDYGKRRGIFDLDLQVRQGEVFGFLGPNGAGKTTTIRLLLDFLRPTRGQARILGMDTRRDGLAIRRHVGYLPGELALYEALTGRHLVERISGMRRNVDTDLVQWLTEHLQADLRRPIGQLSSGNKQKIGLILALMHDPDVWILDEPTSGLDPLMQREVHAMIKAARKRGKTVFLSSHVLPEVERVCDRVGIVREGRLLVVKDLDDFKGHDIQRLVFTFEGPAPRGVFERVHGVHRVEYADNRARVTCGLPVDGVVKAAARYRIVDIDSEDPDLEEAFLSYYRRKGHA